MPAGSSSESPASTPGPITAARATIDPRRRSAGRRWTRRRCRCRPAWKPRRRRLRFRRAAAVRPARRRCAGGGLSPALPGRTIALELMRRPALSSTHGRIGRRRASLRSAAGMSTGRSPVTEFPHAEREQPTAGPLGPQDLDCINAYWRAANYLSVGQIYLLDNPLLREPLTLEHVKRRLLGHWGTTPGLNFVYAHLNRAIRRHDLDAIFTTRPGHGGPAVVANA